MSEIEIRQLTLSGRALFCSRISYSILTCLLPSTKDTKCGITSCTGGGFMQQHTTRINPSEETIKIGPLEIRFLVTGKDSQGSVSVFESACQRGRNWPPRHTRMTPTRRFFMVSRVC